MYDAHPARVILQAHAERLAAQFSGLLEPDISTTRAYGLELHELQVVAPKWHGYSQGLLSILHKDGQPYPATVESSLFPDGAEATDDERLERLVAESLECEEMKSLLSRIVDWSNGVPYPIYTTASAAG